jgi:VCBS repeat-containing protein
VNNLGVRDRIAIVDGKVRLDLSHSLARLGVSDVANLHAGDHIHDVFVYAIRMANGTLSQATVSVDIWGSGGSASMSGTNRGSLTEDATTPVTGMLVVSNPDGGSGQARAAGGSTAKGNWTVDDAGHWSYSVNAAAENHLAAGAHDSDCFTVTSLDGSACCQVTIDIVGVNDAASIAGNDTGSVSEDSAITTGGRLSISDPDDGENLFAAANGLAGRFGTLSLDASGNWTYVLDNAAAQPLANSDHLADGFTVHSIDGTAHDIVVTVNGTYDPDSDTGNDFDLLTGVATGVIGSAGNDVLVGTERADGGAAINGGEGSDVVYAQGGGDIIFGGSAADTLYGQSGDDTINGGAGRDFLYGGSGDDRLNGAGGYDNLWGGSGDDVFVFSVSSDSGGPGGDTIHDFHHGNDRIDVSAIDADSTDVTDTAFAWGGTVATAHGVWFSESAGNTVLHFDSDGNAASDEMTITLTGTGLFLSQADFIL